jgi:2-(1,2-epoxy-1,2-dihydrophenyl)acetyl-CoA isomerase
MLAADLVVAAESARFLTAYDAIGVSPDCGVSYRLAAAVGMPRAMALALTGRRLTAAEAQEWGLVNEVCPDAGVESRAGEVARALAAGPAAALGRTRQLLRAAPSRSLHDHLAAEAASIAQLSVTTEASGRIEAFARRSAARGAGTPR